MLRMFDHRQRPELKTLLQVCYRSQWMGHSLPPAPDSEQNFKNHTLRSTFHLLAHSLGLVWHGQERNRLDGDALNWDRLLNCCLVGSSVWWMLLMVCVSQLVGAGPLLLLLQVGRADQAAVGGVPSNNHQCSSLHLSRAWSAIICLQTSIAGMLLCWKVIPCGWSS